MATTEQRPIPGVADPFDVAAVQVVLDELAADPDGYRLEFYDGAGTLSDGAHVKPAFGTQQEYCPQHPDGRFAWESERLAFAPFMVGRALVRALHTARFGGPIKAEWKGLTDGDDPDHPGRKALFSRMVLSRA